MSARDVKVAREVTEDMMGDRAFTRFNNRITDTVREEDTSLTRATRDRDRATPRDVSNVASGRLRGDLPAPGEFRGALSGRQRKIRSAAKNKVMAAAPASQHRAVQTMLTDENPEPWCRINRELHIAAGDAQQLSSVDRVTVQRLDRCIQSYERINDRTHKVYVAAELPGTVRDVVHEEDLPQSLQPGAVVEFDQFTLTRHNLHETPGHTDHRQVVFEVATSRGMYLGRSDSVEDTHHLLPRGMSFDVVGASVAPYATGPGSFGERLIVQLRERDSTGPGSFGERIAAQLQEREKP